MEYDDSIDVVWIWMMVDDLRVNGRCCIAMCGIVFGHLSELYFSHGSWAAMSIMVGDGVSGYCNML